VQTRTMPVYMCHPSRLSPAAKMLSRRVGRREADHEMPPDARHNPGNCATRRVKAGHNAPDAASCLLPPVGGGIRCSRGFDTSAGRRAAQNPQAGIPRSRDPRPNPARQFGNEGGIAGSEILGAVIALPVIAPPGAHAAGRAVALFEQPDLETGSLQRSGAGHAGDTRPDYGHVTRWVQLASLRSRTALIGSYSTKHLSSGLT
jgi:hypothetical protein